MNRIVVYLKQEAKLSLG